MKRPKAYYREQRRSMILILTWGINYWERESARYHRLVEEMAAIIAGHSGVRSSACRLLDWYEKQMIQADAELVHARRELKKWRAKRV